MKPCIVTGSTGGNAQPESAKLVRVAQFDADRVTTVSLVCSLASPLDNGQGGAYGSLAWAAPGCGGSLEFDIVRGVVIPLSCKTANLSVGVEGGAGPSIPLSINAGFVVGGVALSPSIHRTVRTDSIGAGTTKGPFDIPLFARAIESIAGLVGAGLTWDLIVHWLDSTGSALGSVHVTEDATALNLVPPNRAYQFSIENLDAANPIQDLFVVFALGLG